MIRNTVPKALIAKAKRFAALSGVFEPVDALPAAARKDASTASIVASALAAACDTNPDGGSGWLFRSGERRYVIDTLQSRKELTTAVAARRKGKVDPATRDLLDALAGRGEFAPDTIAAAVEDPVTTRATIERIVTALDRAGAPAPAYASFTAAKLRLAQFSETARRATIDARGFFGREDEKAKLLAWIAKPVTAPPARAALLTGFPGIGKSALLDEMTRIAVDDYNALVVRLDFDRAGLDVLDMRGMTMELARQLSDRIGDADTGLIAARLAAASVSRGQEGYDASLRAQVPGELAQAIGAAVANAKRPVLLILDTLEVLRARGDKHPGQLFEWIDALVSAGLAPLRILAAGRGDVLDNCPERCGERIPLTGLDPDAAEMLLDRMELPEQARAAVIEIADGNPLVLRLAVKVVKSYGARDLPKKQLTGEVTAGFLYRFLLSRITDPDLKRLAHPGMIARRLSAAFLREVLAPTLGMRGMSVEHAEKLFTALASEHWLVERDPGDPQFVRHRGDMRALLLPLLYRDQPAQCARIDAAAVAWFGRQPDEAAQLDAAYHSLQLMRSRRKAPMIDATLARRLDVAAIAELPQAARELVERAKGGRSSKFRGAESSAAPSASDADVTAELLHLIEAGDWVEGAYVVEQIEQAGGIDPRSPAADAIRAYHWRSGRWSVARALLAERDRLGADDGDLLGLPPPVAIARLEMRAEFTPQRMTPARLKAAMPLIEATEGMPGLLARRGALGFLLHTLRAARKDSWDRNGDPVAAAVALWTGEHSPLLDFSFGVARDKLRARGASAADLGWNNPQLLAALTPYPVFVANLARQRGHERLTDGARDADARLAKAGALMTDEALTPAASSPFAGLAELGLFAEWAQAEAMFARDPDLAAIGRAAERWRRTVAGDWRYSGPPTGWQQAGPLDAVLAKRLDRLLDHSNPQDAAHAQLGLWSSRDPAALWPTLQRRFGKSFEAARALTDPKRRAEMLGTAIPTAFVPPVAVLLETPRGEKS